MGKPESRNYGRSGAKEKNRRGIILSRSRLGASPTTVFGSQDGPGEVARVRGHVPINFECAELSLLRFVCEMPEYIMDIYMHLI